MSKKPPALTLVDPHHPATSLASPPSTLAESGGKLWQSIMSEYRIDDAGGLEMLMQICLAADRADECAKAIASDGALIRTKAGFKDHPLLKHELAARSFVVRSLQKLNLDVEPPRGSVAGRPGGSNRGRCDAHDHHPPQAPVRSDIGPYKRHELLTGEVMYPAFGYTGYGDGKGKDLRLRRIAGARCIFRADF